MTFLVIATTSESLDGVSIRLLKSRRLTLISAAAEVGT